MVVVPPANAALVPEFMSSAKSSTFRRLVQLSIPPGTMNLSVASMILAPAIESLQNYTFLSFFSLFTFFRVVCFDSVT